MVQSKNMKTLESKKILFIGGGNMASAIISGLMGQNNKAPDITVIDHKQTNINKFNELYNLKAYNNIDSLANLDYTPDIIILAVKPNVIKHACEQIARLTANNTLIISVAAGITIDMLAHNLPKDTKIIRSMPNTPATVGAGMTILYTNLDKNNQDNLNLINLSQVLFQSVGQTLWVESESEINTTMAISGCGPAYIFLLCESLLEAAKSLGISQNTAKQLITATVNGANKLYINSDKEPGVLRSEVTSPGGTTEAAINTLNPEHFRSVYIKALQAAVDKAKVIEQQLK